MTRAWRLIHKCTGPKAGKPRKQPGMVRALRYTLIGLLMLLVAIATLWAALALWFRLPAPDTVRMVLAGLFALFGAAMTIGLLGHRRVAALGLFAVGLAGVLAWWITITPPDDAPWSPDVARQVSGEIDGDILTLTDIRDFEWRSNDDFTVNWITRSYDLAQLRTVDMFMSYWAGPEMAHFILSFGFANGDQLAWSVEVRRQVGGGFSPVADFFKTNTLAIVAATETDVVGVRSNVRGEDVQIFRLNAKPEVARALLEEYVRDANRLAATPQWYNSLTTNCTTVVVHMMTAIGNGLPLDWRLIANGYLPDYAYDHGALAMQYQLSELRELGQIAGRGKAHGLRPGFSQAIRVGVPTPQSAVAMAPEPE